MSEDLAKWLLKQYDLLSGEEMPDLHLRTCQTHKVMPRGTPLFTAGSPMTCNCPALNWWLDDLASKVQIVKLHVHERIDYSGIARVTGLPAEDVPYLACKTCARRHDDELAFDDKQWCMTLRLLGKPLAHRPGYREEWAPT